MQRGAGKQVKTQTSRTGANMPSHSITSSVRATGACAAVRFEAHYGLKAYIAPCPKGAPERK